MHRSFVDPVVSIFHPCRLEETITSYAAAFVLWPIAFEKSKFRQRREDGRIISLFQKIRGKYIAESRSNKVLILPPLGRIHPGASAMILKTANSDE